MDGYVKVGQGEFVNADGAIKYVCHGRVRHVGSMDRVTSHGVNSDDIRKVKPAELAGLKAGPAVPLAWSREQWVEGCAQSPETMRELMVSPARGAGIEIGAGPFPMAVPLGCNVTYVDKYDMAAQIGRTWPTSVVNDVVDVDRKDSFDTLATFGDGTLDFVIASHVIEHIPSPISAMRAAYRALVPGGFLFLVVPDKRYTFDVDRGFTTIEHLLEDFSTPSSQRDFQHHLEYQQKVMKVPDYVQKARAEFESGMDIHYHVWTVATFYDLIQRVRQEQIVPWSEVWWQPPVRDTAAQPGIEFYFALRK